MELQGLILNVLLILVLVFIIGYYIAKPANLFASEVLTYKPTSEKKASTISVIELNPAIDMGKGLFPVETNAAIFIEDGPAIKASQADRIEVIFDKEIRTDLALNTFVRIVKDKKLCWPGPADPSCIGVQVSKSGNTLLLLNLPRSWSWHTLHKYYDYNVHLSPAVTPVSTEGHPLNEDTGLIAFRVKK